MNELTPKYSKPQQFEKVIQEMNEALFFKQKELFTPVKEDKTSIHVIGAPRSGTTLLTQLMISHLDVGYINNFIATYWKAPLFGIHLSNKLFGTKYISDFKSDLGRTNQILEPHEFGYFWKYQLNYKDFLQQTYNKNHIIDWINFKELLYQMIEAYGKPMVFKSFLLGFHSSDTVKLMPKSVFILIERDLVQNAFSILKFREKLFGSKAIWASMKPIQYELLKAENIYRQVIAQVLFLNYEYKKQFDLVSQNNKLVIKYDELCEKPMESMEKIKNKLDFHESMNFLNLENIKEFEVKQSIVSVDIERKLNLAIDWVMKRFPELINSKY